MAAKTYDVIVIGAGPAGAAAARALVAGGMRTLIVEKKKLPRHKMCSGILSCWAVDFVNRQFGVIPESAYSQEVPFLTGFAAHGPSLPRPMLIPSAVPVPNIWRSHFDHFLAKASGAEIKDGLLMDQVDLEKGVFRVNCRRFRKDGTATRAAYRAKYVVGADGSNSHSVQKVIPEAWRGLPRGSGIQVHYEGEVALSPRHYHMFFYPDMGFYAWASLKDSQVRVGAGALGSAKVTRFHDNFRQLLIREYGLKIKGTIRKEGMTGPLLAPYNRFALGRDNFLAAGDATGIMHNGGEGISCALATGDLAGKAILEAKRTGQKALEVYRETIRGEIELCLDQFNPLRMWFKSPMRIDFKSLWRDYSLREFGAILRDMRAFGKQPGGLGELDVGKTLKRNMLYHLIHGRYPVEL